MRARKFYPWISLAIPAILFFSFPLTSQPLPKPLYKPFKKLTIDKAALVFFVIGDFGRNGELYQTSVAEAMKTCAKMANPKFVVTVGDNFYCCGVKDKNDPQFKTSFERVYKSKYLNIDWYPVLGNHDYMGHTDGELEYSTVNPHWKMPGRYYTMEQATDKGTARFLFIDSNPYLNIYRHQPIFPDIDKQDTARQLRFIDSVLAASQQDKWKFVVAHHPLYSANERGDSKELRPLLKPRLEKYDVQFYVSGHDHNMQHLRHNGDLPDYFISGSGSDTSQVAAPSKYSLFASEAPGFMVFSVTEDVVKAYFVDMNCDILYEYERKNQY